MNNVIYKNLCMPHLNTILYELTIPLLLVSNYEV
jgi:hypothetical protein